MKLLGSVPSPFTRKVRIVLAEKRVECTFERVDGNGVLISGYSRYTTIADSEFVWIGDTAK